MTLLFVKLSIIMAKQEFQVLGSYRDFLFLSTGIAKKFLLNTYLPEAVQCDRTLGDSCTYHCLLLLLIRRDVHDLNPFIMRGICLKILGSYSSEDHQHVIMEILKVSTSNYSMQYLMPCFEMLITSKYFGLIMKYSEIFYPFYEKLVRPLLRHASGLSAKGFNPCYIPSYPYEQGNINVQLTNNAIQEENAILMAELNSIAAIDIVEIVVTWRKQHLMSVDKMLSAEKKDVSLTDVTVIFNILLKMACLVDAHGHSLSKRSISLIYHLIENEVFPISELRFGTWISDLLRNVATHPKEYENCEIFTIMSCLFPHLGKTSLGSFSKQLENNIKDLFDCELKVLVSLLTFLKQLTTKHPPNRKEAEFKILYDNISKCCTNAYFLYDLKAMVLEAIGTYFPSCLNDIVTFFEVLVDNACNVDRTKPLGVALGLMNKLFYSIKDLDKSRMIAKMAHLLKVEGLTAEILLNMIEILDLNIHYLMMKNNGTLILQTTDNYLKLFQGMTNLIKKRFSHDKEICGKFFTMLKRPRCCTELARLYALFGTISSEFGAISREDRAECFRMVSKHLKYDAFSIISFICDDYWKAYEPQFKIRLFIYLLGSLYKNIYIKSSNTLALKAKADASFSLLVDLCRYDKNLAKFMFSILFSITSKILSYDKKLKLCPLVKKFISMCCEQFREGKAPSFLTDMLINPAFRFVQEYVPRINSEKMFRIYEIQVQYFQGLEKSILFSSPSDKQKAVSLQTLTDMHTAIGMNDVELCIDQFIPSYNNFTIHGSELYKRGDYLEAHNSYLKSLELLIKNHDLHTSINEWDRCTKQMARCVAELSNWENIGNNPDYDLLTLMYPISKCKSLVDSPLKCLIMNSRCKLLKIEYFIDLKRDDIYQTMIDCNMEWRSLPKGYLSPNHYSLLQLMQQLNEILDVSHLLDFENRDCDCGACHFALEKKFEAITTRWNFHPYSFNDDYSFITELFNVRQKSLEAYANKCREISPYVAVRASELSNECAIKLAFEGVQFQRMTEHDMRCKEYTRKNAYDLWIVKLKSILTNTKKFASQNKFEETDAIRITSRLDDLLRENQSHFESFDPQRKLTLLLYDNEIRTTVSSHETPLSDLVPFETFKRLDSFVLLAEHYGKNLQKSSSIKDADLVISCLLITCNYGTSLDIQKSIPRILHCLEYDNENSDLTIKVNDCFLKNDALHKYLLPYLPYLILKLQSAVKENKFCNIKRITDILEMLSEKFPQQVFFALESLKGLCPKKTLKKNIEDENIRMENIRMKIYDNIQTLHPDITSKLNTVLEAFRLFGSRAYNNTIVKFFHEVLHTIQCITDENIKNKKLAFAKVLKYLDVHLMGMLKDQISESFVEFMPKNLKLCIKSFLAEVTIIRQMEKPSAEYVINKMEIFVSDFSAAFMTFQPRSIDISKDNPVLSSKYMDSKILLFDQMFSEDASTVKIIKFYDSAEILNCNGVLNCKFKVLGDDGKTYSFSLMPDSQMIQSIESLKLMRLLECLNPLLKSHQECSKRFLKFNFPRYILINTCLKLAAYEDQEILLRNNMPFRNLNISGNTSVKDYFRKWINELISHPSDFDRIRNQLLNELAVLCTAEFLNIRLKKLLTIQKRSARLTVSHLAMNKKETRSSSILTPGFLRLFEPAGIKVLAEYILHILTCFKKNEESCLIMTSMMHLMKKGDDPHDGNYFIVQKICDANLKVIKKFLQGESKFFPWHKNCHEKL